eukprot:scaffold134964_cov47-Prasinocladus_malaysianus.AAC.1
MTATRALATIMSSMAVSTSPSIVLTGESIASQLQALKALRTLLEGPGPISLACMTSATQILATIAQTPNTEIQILVVGVLELASQLVVEASAGDIASLEALVGNLVRSLSDC